MPLRHHVWGLRLRWSRIITHRHWSWLLWLLTPLADLTLLHAPVTDADLSMFELNGDSLLIRIVARPLAVVAGPVARPITAWTAGTRMPNIRLPAMPTPFVPSWWCFGMHVATSVARKVREIHGATRSAVHHGELGIAVVAELVWHIRVRHAAKLAHWILRHCLVVGNVLGNRNDLNTT